MVYNVKTVRYRRKSNLPNLIVQCRCKTFGFALMMPVFGVQIINEPANVRMSIKRKEGTLFGCNARTYGKIPFLSKPKKWQSAHPFQNCSCTTLPTLRLLGIMVATKYANFSLIQV